MWQVSYSLPPSLARTLKNCSQNDNGTENEESISDIDLENIVGAGDTSELEVAILLLEYLGLLECSSDL